MQRARLPGGRLHLCDGPIDLVIRAEGSAAAVEAAYAAATARLDGLLAELVAELALLRAPVTNAGPSPQGPVARRMAEAACPHRAVFVTPMVAVAGAVAEAVLAAMTGAAALERAYVNDGGDIALHLASGRHLDIGVVRSLAQARPEAFVRIASKSPVRGVATSGRHGRSFSLGIADAVTVLAARAADADAAATMIANAVDVADPAIRRRPARELDPDSDLGGLPVTVEVGRLPPDKIRRALAGGVARAQALRARGLIEAALIALAGEWASVGEVAPMRLAGTPRSALTGRTRAS